MLEDSNNSRKEKIVKWILSISAAMLLIVGITTFVYSTLLNH